MALLPFLAVGGLLASSKKVRKEIKRFGKRVKKQLKRTVKSKAFKIIAAAALAVVGLHFVAGMMGAGGGTAATLATTKTAADAGIIARTATAVVNGAKTAYNTLATTGYSAGQSTTAFLSEGFNKITGDATGKAVKDTALNVDATQFSTPADAMVDFQASGMGTQEATLVKAKPPFKTVTPPEPTLTEKMAQVQGNIEATAPTYESITTAPKTAVAETGKATVKQKSLLTSVGEEMVNEAKKGGDTPTQAPPSFSFAADAFEGTETTAPTPIVDFRAMFPLIDPRTFSSSPLDPNVFFRTKQQLA